MALDPLNQTISERIGEYLERMGLLVRDIENSNLDLESLDQSPTTKGFVGSATLFHASPKR